MKVASVEPIVDSVCDTSAENNTCQALENVKFNPIDQSLVDIESDLHVTPEVASDTIH